MCRRLFPIIAILIAATTSAIAQTETERQLLQSLAAKTQFDEKKPGTIRIGISLPIAEMGQCIKVVPGVISGHGIFGFAHAPRR